MHTHRRAHACTRTRMHERRRTLSRKRLKLLKQTFPIFPIFSADIGKKENIHISKTLEVSSKSVYRMIKSMDQHQKSNKSLIVGDFYIWIGHCAVPSAPLPSAHPLGVILGLFKSCHCVTLYCIVLYCIVGLPNPL